MTVVMLMLALHTDVPGEKELLRTLTFTFPDWQFISQEDFAAQVAWPAAPSRTDGEAGVAEASAMEEDAEDDEEEDEDEEEAEDEEDFEDCR
ncbi:hypothetical protein LR48_Vigan233s003000 [Vigna angularis]|uniref:Uncharacterized protein n=1 Tax=Phaseolus angularis TaxID=3914 RepID=A0A0L9T6F9_PHAAN|nr:hypothetical protein LR48_Vigan233s003000 [Vigna angularis]